MTASAQDEHEPGHEHQHDDGTEDDTDELLFGHARGLEAEKERLIVTRSNPRV